MAAIALLKFIQGPRVGGNGHALIVNEGVSVTIENGGDNSNVQSWRIEVLSGPPGSVFETAPGVPLLLAQNANSGLPLSAATPPVGIPGCLRVRLSVWAQPNFAGTPDVDIRNICVLTPLSSIVLPPYQKLPDPIALERKPDELNFEGQPFGWAGPNYNHPVYGQSFVQFRLLNSLLLELDAAAGGGGGTIQEIQTVNGLAVTNGMGPVVSLDAEELYPRDGSRPAGYFVAKAEPLSMSGIVVQNSADVDRLEVVYDEATNRSIMRSYVAMRHTAPSFAFGTTISTEAMVIDATTESTKADGYALVYNAGREALDYAYVGLPPGGANGQYVTPGDLIEDVVFPRRVDTVSGTDLWVGSGGVLDTANTLTTSLIYSSDSGDSWATEVDPMGGTFTSDFIVTDALTGRTFVLGGLPNTLGGPISAVIAEMTDTSPVTILSPSPIPSVGAGTMYALHAVIAPGNGKLYYAGSFNSGSPRVVEYDIVTGAALQDCVHGSEPPQTLYYDGSVAKYGDAFARIYWATKNSGFGRASLGAFATPEESTQTVPGVAPGGGSGWGATFGGLTINGPDNVGYVVARNFNNGNFYIIKVSLEPFLTVQYVQLLVNDSSAYPGLPILDATLDRVVMHYELQSVSYPGGWVAGHLVLVEDTGAALVILHDMTVPEPYGGITWRNTGGVSAVFDPEPTLIDGKVYLPMNGGRNQSAGPWDLLSNVLQVDHTGATLTVVNLTSVPGYVWSDLDGGDLAFSPPGELNVVRLGGVDLDYPGMQSGGGSPPVGSVLRDVGGTFVGTYNNFAATVSSASGVAVSVPVNYDGYYLIRTSGTGPRAINFSERPSDVIPGFGAYDQTFSDFGGSAGYTNRYMHLTPQNSRLIYGWTGSNTGVSLLRLKSAWESVQLTWDDLNVRWKVTGRYRPWEPVNFTAATATTQLYGGKLLIAYNSASGSGTRSFILPGTVSNDAPEHGDEVIIYDEGGNSSVNPFQVRGGNYPIQGLSGVTNILFNTVNAFVHLVFDMTEGKWTIVGRSYPTVTLPVSPTEDGMFATGLTGNLSYKRMDNWRPNGRQRRITERLGGLPATEAQLPLLARTVNSPGWSTTTAIESDGRRLFSCTTGSGNGNGRVMVARMDLVDYDLGFYEWPAPFNPKDLLYFNGSLFVGGNFSIAQLNPDTMTVTQTWAITGGASRLETDGVTIFFVNINGVGTIRPGDANVYTTVTGGSFNLFDVVYADGIFWVSSAGGTLLRGFIEQHGSALGPTTTGGASLTVPSQGRGVTYDGNRVWLVHHSTSSAPNTLTWVDPATKTFANVAVTRPAGYTFSNEIVFDGAFLLVGGVSGGVSNKILYIDPDTLRTVATPVGRRDDSTWKMYQDGILMMAGGGGGTNGDAAVVMTRSKLLASTGDVYSARRQYPVWATPAATATYLSQNIETDAHGFLPVKMRQTGGGLNLVELYGACTSYSFEGPVDVAQVCAVVWGGEAFSGTTVMVDARHTGAGSVTFEGHTLTTGNWYIFQYTFDPQTFADGWNISTPFPNVVRT